MGMAAPAAKWNVAPKTVAPPGAARPEGRVDRPEDRSYRNPIALSVRVSEPADSRMR